MANDAAAKKQLVNYCRGGCDSLCGDKNIYANVDSLN